MATTEGAGTPGGFRLACPYCGNEGVIILDLNDLDDVSCAECQWNGPAEEALEKVRANADRWDILARWIATAAAAIRTRAGRDST